MERTRRSLLQQPGEFHAAMWEMIAGLELESEISGNCCPTLVVTGEADVNAPPAAADTIARGIPGASLTLMPELGHFSTVRGARRLQRDPVRLLAETDAKTA